MLRLSLQCKQAIAGSCPRVRLSSSNAPERRQPMNRGLIGTIIGILVIIILVIVILQLT